jgi:hypothetical protein
MRQLTQGQFAQVIYARVLTCGEVEKQIRKAVGSYDKTKVYNLPIDNVRV